MGADDGGEMLLAGLELTRGLAIQMTALGTLGFVVALTGLSALFQAVVGHPVSFQFGPAGVAGGATAVGVRSPRQFR